MPTDADFLRAIVADPDADAPRLAYADWRDECGDAARAEFVRAQCALAALPNGERAFHPLRDRERELRLSHEREWLRPFAALLGPDRPVGWRRWLARSAPWHARFRRGFVEVLALGLDEYVRHADALGRLTPLRDLSLLAPPAGPTRADAVDRLVDCPQLAALSALSLRLEPLLTDEFRRLVECPHLSGLRELTVGTDLDPACVRALARSPLLGHLDRLDLLDSPRIGGAGIAPLFADPAARGLIELGLNNLALTAADLRDLTAGPPLPRLRWLGLADNLLGDDLPAPFLDWLPETVTALDFRNTGLGDAAAAGLAEFPVLRRLLTLDLSGNAVTDVGALALADSPHLLATTRLDLQQNPLSDRVRNALRIRLGHHVLV